MVSGTTKETLKDGALLAQQPVIAVRVPKGYQAVKRVIDLVLALAFLVVFGPILLLIALIVRLDSAGPAIYRQARVGRLGALFTFYKYRTMRVGTPVLSTEDMQRQQIKPYTRIGPFLRKSSFDELPQLFNIIKGEMSFVGPRPALPSQTDVNELRKLYGVDAVRPGITGLAQARGRDDLDVETRSTTTSITAAE